MPKLSAAVATIVAAALIPSAAEAAPVSATLRIEGPTKTLYEGPVTTDVVPFVAKDGPHECGTTAPVRNNLISTSGVPYVADWFEGLGASFESINGESVAYDPVTNKFLGEYENGQFAQVGGCSDTIAQGDEALYAYGDGSEQLLRLTGPGFVRPGEPFAVKVTDAGTGAPVAGASVIGQPGTTNAAGEVAVPGGEAGPRALKAEKPGAIRSNRWDVCATTGSDGACGTSKPGDPPTPILGRDTTRPSVSTPSVTRRRVRATVGDAQGLSRVQVRVLRLSGNGVKCGFYDGERERFVRRRCGTGSFVDLPVGTKVDLQLASRLGKGRYAVSVRATDRAGLSRTVRREVRFR